MAAENGAQHRSGNLKQSNKNHKSGRHRSKGQISRENQGRVNVKAVTKRRKGDDSRVVRRNQAKVSRQLQREKVLEKKRQIGGQHSPPHFVVLVGLSGAADCHAVLGLLNGAVKESGGTVSRNDQGIEHFSIPRFKKRMSFYIPDGSVRDMLDAAKVADSVLFVTSVDEIMDQQGEYCLKCLMGQGISHYSFVCHGLNQVPQKKLSALKKSILKELEQRVPEPDLHPLDTPQEAMTLIYKTSMAKVRPVHYRDDRAHLIAEKIEFLLANPEDAEGTLKVSGYVRGADLSADRLLHITGWGTYQIAQIDFAQDPYPLSQKAGNASMETEILVLARPDPKLQVSLISEVEVDPMQDEQTFPTDEELQEADERAKQMQKMMEEDEQEGMKISDDESDDDDDDDDDMEEDSDDGSCDPFSDEQDKESVTMTETDIDAKYDVHFDIEAEKLQLKQLKEEREHVMFPDEVETPHDMPARERFAKYRGLASFRTSPWHKDEELPSDYQRLLKVNNMKALRKGIQKRESSNSVSAGQYVTVHIKCVPAGFMDTYQPGRPLVMFGLLAYEQMMSVLNVAVKRDRDSSDTIKSKARLIFQVGFRRFSACPIFSQLKKGDKFKMERFFPYNEMTVMSMYAPITFGTCPVLVFKENAFGEEHLVGGGSIYSFDPDRIVLKRTILSGDMFKMGKKKSVVRFMFFNREDINWFKRVDLRTKLNRRGRILEPIGTHGHMKCHFSGQPKSQDVVLMYLYKRVYPKWTYQPEELAKSSKPEDEN